MIRKEIKTDDPIEVQQVYSFMINKIENEYGSSVWRDIRKGDYWEIRDALPNQMEKQKLTIDRISEWLKKNR
jgi:hypothetical protein